MDPNTRALMMGAAGAAGGEKIYVENVFSTWLYTGNGSTQTITNGIDLSGKGGLVWMKTRARSSGDFYSRHFLYDSARGLSATSYLHTNASDAQGATGSVGSAPTFLSDGFIPGPINLNTETYASWTLRKAAKFFDVVTYTGTGSNRTIAHSLGSVPGTLFVKRTDSASDWQVYHRSLATTEYIVLNSTAAKATGTTRWNSTTPTSTEFSLGTDATVNASGGTYVAYLFAHDAGGFGDTGSDNVVSCGSYTGNGSTSGPTVTLGWEPQWLLIKQASGTAGEDWYMFDSMRGIATGGSDAFLRADLSAAENASSDYVDLLPTGFQPKGSGTTATNQSGTTYIYIAIRRGPMKTPTDATKVFSQVVRIGTGVETTITGTGFAPDAIIYKTSSNAIGTSWQTRLQGGSPRVASSSIAAESADNEFNFGATMDGIRVLTGDGVINLNSWTYINYFLRRAPGFFDVVAYTGTTGPQTVTHGLTVTPELLIHKTRSDAFEWFCWHKNIGGADKFFQLQSNMAVATSTTAWNNTLPTTTQFTVSSGLATSGRTYIVYLFASCPGVSKVGSYTGTGTTLNIDCGFTAGARFVMIKRTDSTGDWYVWDTARGIVSGNDPYILFNSTAAEVTSTDYIDPLSSGFQISSTAPAAINASGGSFIFLAIA